MMIYPEPGDWCVCKISGVGGQLISFGEWANGAKAFTTWDHALVYLGGGMVLQAEPGGAQIVERGKGGYLPGDYWSTGIIAIPDRARAQVPTVGERYKGVPYSGLDYLSLVARRLHIPAPGLRAYIKSSGHMICSQLVDKVMQDIGVHLFDDGPERWNGDVTPYDLGNLLWRQSHGGLNHPARTVQLPNDFDGGRSGSPAS